MKILHVYKTYFPDTFGGVEQTIHQLCTLTARNGMHNRIFTLSDHSIPPILFNPEAEIYRYPIHLKLASTYFSFSCLSGFRKLVQWADVVHYHFPWPFADVLHFLTGVKKPTVVTYHSDIVQQKKLLRLYHPLMQRFLKNTTAIVATSPNYVATSPVLQTHQNKIHIIPIGLQKNSEISISADQLNHWKQRLGDRFFLFVGVLRYYKGLHILLEAAQNTTFPIVIAGSGPLENELKAQSKKYNLKNVIFLGALSETDKMALYQLCYAVVFPSHLRSEAFGLTLLEGAMHSKPLISCEIGTGTSYINIHNETGLVVAPDDPLALRQAMQFMYDHPEQANTFGQQAYTRYRQWFLPEQMAMQYMHLYKQIKK